MHNTTGWNRTNLVSRVEEVCAGRKRERGEDRGQERKRGGEGKRGRAREEESRFTLVAGTHLHARTADGEEGGEKKRTN